MDEDTIKAVLKEIDAEIRTVDIMSADSNKEIPRRFPKLHLKALRSRIVDMSEDWQIKDITHHCPTGVHLTQADCNC